MRLLGEDAEIIVWWATHIECLAALRRKARSRELSRTSLQAGLEQLDALMGHAHVVMPADAVFARAKRLLAVHPLGAHDALQMAAALTWARERPAGAFFMCLDSQLRTAAEREGFTVQP